MTINENPIEGAPHTITQQPPDDNTTIKEIRKKFLGLLKLPEVARPFTFKRLWKGQEDTIVEFDENKGHKFHPQTFQMKCPQQKNYSARKSYERIEEVLNQNQGELMKKIAREQFNVTNSRLISNPSILMVFGGEEYIIFRIAAEPNIDFIVAVSRNPASNESMKIDYEISQELRVHEAQMRGITEKDDEWKSPTGLGVMPHMHYEPGETEKPALLMSPHIHNSYGVYADPNCRRLESGDLILDGNFSEKPNLEIKTDEDEKKLLHQLASHQLMLATSGRVTYPSLRRADYIYIQDSKGSKFILTCHRSPEFIERMYKNRNSFGYMYAPSPITDTYDSAVKSCFVQTLHLIFLMHGEGFFGSCNK